jgi:hypothetical protein
VVTFTADLGQGEELGPARHKAELLGIKPQNIFMDDLRELAAGGVAVPPSPALASATTAPLVAPPSPASSLAGASLPSAAGSCAAITPSGAPPPSSHDGTVPGLGHPSTLAQANTETIDRARIMAP